MKDLALIPLLVYLGIFLLILLLSELSYRLIFKDSEYTRKVSHAVTGCVTLAFPVFFTGQAEVLILGAFSFLLLYISKKAGIFHSIHRIERHSHGAILLPVAIYICYSISDWQDNKAYFILPVLILSISDPLAGLVGSKVKSTNWQIFGPIAATKTIAGSLSFFISALIILLIALPYFLNLELIILIIAAMVIAFVSCMIEMISGKGSDNLTVPLSVLILVFLLIII